LLRGGFVYAQAVGWYARVSSESEPLMSLARKRGRKRSYRRLSLRQNPHPQCVMRHRVTTRCQQRLHGVATLWYLGFPAPGSTARQIHSVVDHSHCLATRPFLRQHPLRYLINLLHLLSSAAMHDYPSSPRRSIAPAPPKQQQTKKAGAPKAKGVVRAESGCYTCRIRCKVGHLPALPPSL
jgi:hypothetical protein